MPFKLKATRDDCAYSSFEAWLASKSRTDIHAFLAWFDISFNACRVPVKFSTGPHAKYTHWKYVVSSSVS